VYDLVTTCLVDEHLQDLRPLYREAARLLEHGGHHVLVGYHPHFIMAVGIPTHFDRRPGESVAIETYVHLLSDHVAAARAADLSLIEMRERLVDDRWIALKPRWGNYRNHPVSFAMVWRRE
jgi:SAM-dependent methyltransferase